MQHVDVGDISDELFVVEVPLEPRVVESQRDLPKPCSLQDGEQTAAVRVDHLAFVDRFHHAKECDGEYAEGVKDVKLHVDVAATVEVVREDEKLDTELNYQQCSILNLKKTDLIV